MTEKTVVEPVTPNEVLHSLKNPLGSPGPKSTGEIARAIWMRRGTTTPQVRDQHVRPVVKGMLAAEQLVAAVGASARGIGRVAAARPHATYYELPDRARAAQTALDERKKLREQATVTVTEIMKKYPHVFRLGEVTSEGSVRFLLTVEQAVELLDRLNSSTPAMGR